MTANALALPSEKAPAAPPAKKRGLFTRNRGGVKAPFPIGDTICLAPPLVTTEQEIDRIVAILHEAIRAATSA